MASRCPECGAPFNGPDNCNDRFYRFLAMEMADPDYGAVHHLTVATYMLQHPSHLSLQGWRAMRELLNQALSENLSPEALRARIRPEVDSGGRSWSLVKGPRMQLPVGFTWSVTILSVNDLSAEQYRSDIERWARQALADASRIMTEDG